MMQSELLLPNSNFPNDQDMDLFGILDDVFLSSFASPGDSSMVSSDSHFPDMFPDGLFDDDNMLMNPNDDDDFEKISGRDIDDICDWIYANHNEGTSSSAEAEEWSPCPSLESSQNIHVPTNMPITLPGKDMELGNELSLTHLLRAYGEAMDDGNNGSLARVIVESINERSSPQGNTMERVAYNMFKSKDEHGEYLRQESIKNFVTAFNVLYQSLICGRFAHNAANSAILESVPDDATVLHIVDFDIGEGIQWPTLIEALSQKKKLVKLTSIKLGEDDISSCWEFEETKERLQVHARQYGVKLQIEEKCIDEFAVELMKRKKNGHWLVFNCMVALPHMARRRRRSRVIEFLKVAEELLASFDGIVTLGDGEAGDGLGDCISFESYFGKLLVHYRALFESLECNFPAHLVEARTAMECLFLAPFMCPVSWLQEWREMAKYLEFDSILKGRKVSPGSLGEAKVMVNERADSYNVEIRGLSQNVMVLRWKETMLVKFSTFCSRR
ncbi:hypothetical protein C2S52_022817 [Perilla frutescens var. hirtella]|nr:hypothetical protein C2S52_022817 [Perilla frutescens var. hirtella]